MKEISLTQGRVALVDDEDFEELNKFKWHTQPHGNTFYVIRNTPRKPGKHQGTERMHRVILNIPEGMETDHIDGDGLNNQKSNLRIATHRQNSQNLALKQTKKTSKFPGVFWDKRKSKWCACIRINGSQKHIGYFLNENEANIAYRVAEKIVVNIDYQNQRERASIVQDEDGYVEKRPVPNDEQCQCGDECKGECSGEVTGTPFCPLSEREKVLDKLERVIRTYEHLRIADVLYEIEKIRQVKE